MDLGTFLQLGGTWHTFFRPSWALEEPVIGVKMDVSKNSGTSKSSHFNRVFHYKPSIFGFHYFWKHPNGVIIQPLNKWPENTWETYGEMMVTKKKTRPSTRYICSCIRLWQAWVCMHHLFLEGFPFLYVMFGSSELKPNWL